ncbi:MAG TPA: OmpA family protein [Bacteroidia bacterium]|jgi:outer membrane protein OmpA-like peptidoglycan-associated protein
MKYICYLICSFLFLRASSQVERNIYFASGKSELKQVDKHWLDSMSAVLKSPRIYSIIISGYCDSDGSEKSNLVLAEERADAVKEIFIANKIDQGSVAIKALGEDQPLGDNTTAAGKAANRRAHVIINILPETDNAPDGNIKDQGTGINVEEKKSKDSTLLSAGKLEIGQTLILKNLNFEGGTPVLLLGSEPVLKDLLKIMKANPTLEIEIGGHVCCADDMPLSVMRAQRVYNYLKNHGVHPERMKYKGYSRNKPLASENTEEGRTANRRVEITILKK